MSNRGRHAKKIDTVHWTGFILSALSLSAGSAAQTAAPAQHLPETLLRIRGEWSATLDGGVASGVLVGVTAGLILVPEGTGTTVLWSPFTDDDAPWIWWDHFGLIYNEMVTDVISIQNTLSRARVVDSKAMRKIRNTELQFVVENTTINVGAGVDVTMGARVLAGS